MTHIKQRWLQRTAAVLGLGLTLSLMAPPSVLAASSGGKKKAVATHKVVAKTVQKKARVVAERKKVVRVAHARSARHALVQARAMPAAKASRQALVAQQTASAALADRAAASESMDPRKLSANAALVMDQNSREVLLSKNDKAVMPIASLTKLMTGLLVADARLPLDEEITITDDDVDTYKGTGSRLAIGTRLTRGELMHLALMSSENRAAHALGRTYPGGLDHFVRLMNQKAAELGMRDTRYIEPTGLSVENRSSAHDLALLVATAYQRPLLREFTTSTGYQVESGRRVLQYRNSNRLIDDPKWNIGLQKTGYIVEAGRCMVMSAKLAGRQVIMVFLDAADKSARIGDAQRVRRWFESGTQIEHPELAAFRHG